jgi:carboxypeptidase PM20D1
MFFGNPRFFEGAIKSQLTAASSETNAWLRTTTAATVFEGSIQDNVLPARARAVVNFRILPGDSIAGVIEHARQVIDDPQVQISPLEQEISEPSSVSDTNSPNFEVLQRTIHQVFPEAVVTPGLVFVTTDCRHYAELSSDIYRFLPILAEVDDLGGIHGTNERISIESYERMVRFYIQLIRNSAL